MSKALKLYYDLMSQPSRALWIFLEKTKIPYERCLVNLGKGEHLTDEFKAINRFQKVPCIADNQINLAETVAIIRYLAREYQVPDHWYPADTRQRARVDEYLEWQHHNTRAMCAVYFQYMWLRPRMFGKKVDPSRAEQYKAQMESCLDFIEREFLGGGSRFIVGEEISFADLLAACEIEQPKMAGYDPCAGRPKLTEWMARVRDATNPYYDQAHKLVYKIAPETVPKPKL
ncbi:glutathione S-transferase theta-1-like [Anopheles ziemanni]|uniref:glutathione S-transferase theta-1-like n=1 Tax=Anopheles ziemanni TaxID=345580 RepID=UPI002659015E|nr:glutathione S-transferase theta-1-like isoform X2 [Anopheles coustani]XP_058176618.1 glutathione S-transferase theta-1-like [Anopheles ziemanni]